MEMALRSFSDDPFTARITIDLHAPFPPSSVLLPSTSLVFKHSTFARILLLMVVYRRGIFYKLRGSTMPDGSWDVKKDTRSEWIVKAVVRSLRPLCQAQIVLVCLMLLENISASLA